MPIELYLILDVLLPIVLGGYYALWGLLTIRERRFTFRVKGIRTPITMLPGTWSVIVGVGYLLGGGLLYVGWHQKSILASVGCFLPQVLVLFCLIMHGLIKLGKYLFNYSEKPKNDQKLKHGE